MDNPMHEQVQALKAEVSHLQSNVAELTSALRAAIGRETEELKQTVEDDVQQARIRLREVLSSARTRGHHAVGEMEEGIGHRPFTSVVAALGIGFVIAKLLDMRAKH